MYSAEAVLDGKRPSTRSSRCSRFISVVAARSLSDPSTSLRDRRGAVPGSRLRSTTVEGPLGRSDTRPTNVPYAAVADHYTLSSEGMSCISIPLIYFILGKEEAYCSYTDGLLNEHTAQERVGMGYAMKVLLQWIERILSVQLIELLSAALLIPAADIPPVRQADGSVR